MHIVFQKLSLSYNPFKIHGIIFICPIYLSVMFFFWQLRCLWSVRWIMLNAFYRAAKHKLGATSWIHKLIIQQFCQMPYKVRQSSGIKHLKLKKNKIPTTRNQGKIILYNIPMLMLHLNDFSEQYTSIIHFIKHGTRRIWILLYVVDM
jgi:hypothetical protein